PAPDPASPPFQQPAREIAELVGLQSLAESRRHQRQSRDLAGGDLAQQNPVRLTRRVEEREDFAALVRHEAAEDGAIRLLDPRQPEMGIHVAVRIEDVLGEAGQPPRADPVELRPDQSPYPRDAMAGGAMGREEGSAASR